MSLSSLSVPNELIDEHLAIINGYSAFAQAIGNLENAQKDPVKAVVSMGVLEEVELDQNFAFRLMAEYFRERGIIFGDDEPSILWDQY
jgi:hypothetical protein